RKIHTGSITDNIDEPIERVQAPEQIIIFAVSAGQEGSKMPKTDAFETGGTVEALERAGVLRAYSIDQDLTQFANRTRAYYRQSQDVPEWKAEIVDQHLSSCVGMPFCRIERGQ